MNIYNILDAKNVFCSERSPPAILLYLLTLLKDILRKIIVTKNTENHKSEI